MSQDEEKRAPELGGLDAYEETLKSRPRESIEMKYLRNIVTKLGWMQNSIDHLETRLDELDVSMIQLGHGNSEAFKMCKKAVQALAENQEMVQQDLSDACGNIRDCSWNDVLR